MPPIEQLFDSDLHHLCFGHGAHSSSESHVECGQSAVNGCLGKHAEAHG